MKLVPGSLFASDYEVIRELSTGGMGTLYVVLQRSTGKQRALKLMLPQFVADTQLRRRFEQEARVASLVDSDHVVEVVGAGIDEPSGSPWLAMELLRGQELSAESVQRTPNPLLTVHAILRQVCHALGAAHRAGIVHRDLKPANIYLAESKRAGESWTVKVLDFGIAKIAAEAMTQQTAAMGSPVWMAPEQSEKGPVTAAADVWALGLVAYNLLTDRYFWHAAENADGTVHQVMREVLFDPIPTASQRAREQGAPPLPPWFDAWFARCVVRDPALRFADAHAAFAMFDQAFTGGTPLSMPVISVIPPASLPLRPSGHPARSNTQMGSGMTQPAVVIAPPRSRARFVIPFLGLAAIGAVSAFAWRHRNTVPHVDAVPPPSDVPSATAFPDDEDGDDDVESAPPLASGSASPVRPKKKKKVPAPSTPSAIPSALSAELAKIPSYQPPAPAVEPPLQPAPGEFDRPMALREIHNVDLQHCARPNGPRGPGRVRVFFGNDGHARNFVFDPGGLYTNTPEEQCIARALEHVYVTPYAGATQSVLRMFALR